MKWWLLACATLVPLHELALHAMSKLDVVSCLLAPGPHVPLGILALAVAFVVLRLSVVLFLPAVLLLLFTHRALMSIARRSSRSGTL